MCYWYLLKSGVILDFWAPEGVKVDCICILKPEIEQKLG